MADSYTNLISVFTDIAKSINGLGVSGRMTPYQMLQKINFVQRSLDDLLAKKYGSYGNVCLNFTAEQANSTIKLQNVSGTYKTSTDGKNWTDYTLGTTITLANVGDKVYFSARTTNASCSSTNYYSDRRKFVMTGKIAADGNIQYLLDAAGRQTTVPQNAYAYLFYGQNQTGVLVSAPQLPATTLANNCYYYMFGNCESLSAAPELQATTLASGCYNCMFCGCKSLAAAPELPATTLFDSCYYDMFSGCTSLATAPQLPATTLVNYCYRYMFCGCTSLKNTLGVTFNNLPAGSTTYMFSGCNELEFTPTVNATDSDIYVDTAQYYWPTSYMFYAKKITDIYLPNITRAQFEAKGGYFMAPTQTKTIHCQDQTFSYSFGYPECFVMGTKITLADSSKKNVEDLTYDDQLLVFDFDEGKLSSSKICWLTRAGLFNDHYYKLTLSDGTVLKTTGKNSNHKVYNVDERYFKGVDKTTVGDRLYREDGSIVTVISKEYVQEKCEYYNLITSKNIDCFAEGVLVSDRYGNMYPVDENMKYVKDDRQIRPYSEFEAAGISRYWYDNLRLGENTETIEETVKYINKITILMRPIEENEQEMN